jgi:hypothetical protein
MNALPPFSPTGILPPFVGEPASLSGRSPYQTTLVDVAKTFGRTSTRRELLRGLIAYRKLLRELGFRGFQWLDGSFVEYGSIEPKDIDVLTFIQAKPDLSSIQPNNRELLAGAPAKQAFTCDAYFLELDVPAPAPLLVKRSCYWYSLFSHRRSTFEWKGLIEVALGEEFQDDDDAIAQLQFAETELKDLS